MLLRLRSRGKLRRYRNEIPELNRAGIAFRPLIWSADGRPHAAVTRTLRFAAGCAATRGGQQAAASELTSRWKHEIQIAILRRRAAMTRAVLPRWSVRSQFLLTGQVDRDAGCSERAPPVDDDDDPESEEDEKEDEKEDVTMEEEQ